jgi:hypothetical protein
MSYGTDGPQGLQPFLYLGGTWSGQQSEYSIASGYNTSLFYGDPVYVLADGTIGRATAGAGNPITGVFVGVKYTDTDGNFVSRDYWLANTATQGGLNAAAYVADDPLIIFNIQAKNSTGAPPTINYIAAADINANIDLAAGAGSTRTQQSGFYADVSTLGAGATKQLKIVGFTPIPNNGPGINYNNILVVINNNPLRSGGTGSLGV